MPQQPDTVLIHPASPSWHRNPDCDALDTASIHGGKTSTVSAEQAADRRPCLVCADDTFEWTVTPDNIFELWEIVGPSKPHYGSGPDGVVLDGLTIWEHGGAPKTVARIGDTIRFHNGLYRVTAPAAEGV